MIVKVKHEDGKLNSIYPLYTKILVFDKFEGLKKI